MIECVIRRYIIHASFNIVIMLKLYYNIVNTRAVTVMDFYYKVIIFKRMSDNDIIVISIVFYDISQINI